MSAPILTEPKPVVPRQFSPETLAELETICARYPHREAALLPAMRLLEREFGSVDTGGMIHIANLIGVSPSKVYGVLTFYTHFKRDTDGKYCVQVCSTLSCALAGSERIHDHIRDALRDQHIPSELVTLKKVECLADCDQAPCLQVNEDFMDRVTPADADAMLAGIQKAEGEKQEYHPPAQKYHLPPNPLSPNILLKPEWMIEGSRSHTIEHYLARGGYDVAKRVVNGEKTPEDVVEAVFQSGLRGRGGAGFTTGQKWKFLAKNDKPRYLVVNCDESEPGTFKDKLLVDKDPHGMLEGIILGAYAIHSKTAYIYIRGEFGPGTRRLIQAVDEAYASGFLGQGIFGSTMDLDITVHRGGGAYICGEETGLLSSLEGGRGHPKIKPPFPAVEGAWGCPTIVNNVETLQCLPHILDKGVEWFKSIGTPKSAGMKIFSVSGDVERPGNYELPLGVPLKQLIELAGGVKDGKKLKAVCPGGSSSPFLTAEEVLREENPICLDFESLQAAGSMLGSGAIIVMDEDTSMPDVLWNILRFYAHESCGQCTPCREGTGWIAKMAGRIAKGSAKESDIDMLDEVAWSMVGRTICVLADAAAMPARSIVRKFRPEFEEYIRTHRAAKPANGMATHA